ncbi:MAG: Gfo/Idh/MocA family oxidoreductase [Verrucomicrobia bacterium]|nr:Gfo/Idh/MocA family oxidoreductase [Verrucomicrobiota bacterium]
MMKPHPQQHHTKMCRRTFGKKTMHMLAAASTTGLAIQNHGQTPGRQLRLGLVSAATYGRPGEERKSGSNHGTAFATTFNGWDEGKAAEFEGVFVKSQRRLSSARVVKVWDTNPQAARAMAAACRIDTVTDTPEQCCDDVDAVILIDDGTGEQWKYALDSLEKGIPTFCDKPLAMNARDASRIARLSKQTGTPLMSASSLRFVPDIIRLREELPKLGNVHLASATCGNDLIYYGIHALSMIYAVLGRGAVSAINVGRPGANIARIRFANDLDVVLTVAEQEKMRAGYEINLHGTKGWRHVIPNLAHLYSYLLEAFMDYVLTGNESVPIDEEVEVIAALEAAERSLKLGREVMISEVL